MFMYDWVPLLSMWKYHNIVNRLYSSIKLIKFKKSHLFKVMSPSYREAMGTGVKLPLKLVLCFLSCSGIYNGRAALPGWSWTPLWITVSSSGQLLPHCPLLTSEWSWCHQESPQLLWDSRVARKSSEVPHLPCLQIVSSLGDTTVPLILGLWVFRDFPQEQSFFTYCHQGLLGKGTGESFSWSISLWSSWQGLGEWSARLVNMTDHLRMSNPLKF